MAVAIRPEPDGGARGRREGGAGDGRSAPRAHELRPDRGQHARLRLSVVDRDRAEIERGAWPLDPVGARLMQIPPFNGGALCLSDRISKPTIEARRQLGDESWGHASRGDGPHAGNQNSHLLDFREAL